MGTLVINDNYCTINSTFQGGEFTYSFHLPELILTRQWRAGSTTPASCISGCDEQ